MLTKKHFQSAARKLARSSLSEEQTMEIASILGDIFQEENPRFNPERFLGFVEKEMFRARYEEKKRLGAVAVALRPQIVREER